MLLLTITSQLTKLIYTSIAKHHSAHNKSMELVTEQEKSSVKTGFSHITKPACRAVAFPLHRGKKANAIQRF